MAKFRIALAGSNCLLVVDGVPDKHGFFTTRFVEAPSVEKARRHALALVDKELDGILSNGADDPPVFEIERVDQIESFASVTPPGRGFTWYVEEEPQ